MTEKDAERRRQKDPRQRDTERQRERENYQIEPGSKYSNQHKLNKTAQNGTNKEKSS